MSFSVKNGSKKKSTQGRLALSNPQIILSYSTQNLYLFLDFKNKCLHFFAIFSPKNLNHTPNFHRGIEWHPISENWAGTKNVAFQNHWKPNI